MSDLVPEDPDGMTVCPRCRGCGVWRQHVTPGLTPAVSRGEPRLDDIPQVRAVESGCPMCNGTGRVQAEGLRRMKTDPFVKLSVELELRQRDRDNREAALIERPWEETEREDEENHG